MERRKERMNDDRKRASIGRRKRGKVTLKKNLKGRKINMEKEKEEKVRLKGNKIKR